MPWLKLFPLLLTLLSFLQPLAANASTLLLPLAAAESADVSAAHRDTVSFCRSTAKDSAAHSDAPGASAFAVVDGTAVAADYENIGGGIADFGMVAVIGVVKGAGEAGAKGGAGGTLHEFSNVATRTTRGGSQGVRLTRSDGSVIDITRGRVKEFVTNTHPNAPPGTLQRVLFENAQPGSKGFKRDPTPEELRLLEEAFR